MVESVGEGVRSVQPSDPVAFTRLPGAYAEAILADAGKLERQKASFFILRRECEMSSGKIPGTEIDSLYHSDRL